MNETPLEQKTKYRAGILFMGNRLDRCHLRLLCSHVIDSQRIYALALVNAILGKIIARIRHTNRNQSLY